MLLTATNGRRVNPTDLATPELSCDACGADWPLDYASVRCPCGGVLDWHQPRLGGAHVSGPGIWRYAEWLPAFPLASRVSLGEPITPVVEVEGAIAKLDYLLPTASFKDRGSAIVATWLVAIGAEGVVIDSSGNAGASLAGYLAAASIPVSVFVPEGTSRGKLAQVEAYGADLHAVPGSRDDVTAACLAFADRSGRVYASHQWSPFFLAGVASTAYELVDQVPDADAIVVPTGAGTLLLGLHRGYSALVAAGRIPRAPRFIAVQPEAFAPLAGESAIFERHPTIAEGVRVAHPPRRAQLLRAISTSGGTVITASEGEIYDAWSRLAAAGHYVEPTSALALAGLRCARKAGALSPADRAIMILTGSGLKLGGERVQPPASD